VLQDHEQDLLREIALGAIAAELDGRPHECDFPQQGPLAALGSAFVTLRKGGRLRGCIGLVGHRHPLARSVQEAARRALTDSRFPRVTAEELPDLDLEISVLSEFSELTDVEALMVGRHGLLVTTSGRSGLLLPQVAVEHEWDREAFLAHACLKAGLPPEEWRRPDLKIEVFEALVF